VHPPLENAQALMPLAKHRSYVDFKIVSTGVPVVLVGLKEYRSP
jgi:hypothetical protein